MKYLAPLMVMLTLIGASVALAIDIDEIFDKPIVIKATSSEKMNVTFQHASHADISCETCHHAAKGDDEYTSCSVKGCHSFPGPRERRKMSTFMAYHAKDTDRSCYGCHNQLREEEPEAYPAFRNCQPCHISPQGAAE
ncbi:cytochrome c3 family protein [Desulfovibrio sp. OttesenSCG-928-F07]|nr:cytochrome c3 family protein [Desulfovibrio sp. OttesenSCG-928-F07]